MTYLRDGICIFCGESHERRTPKGNYRYYCSEKCQKKAQNEFSIFQDKKMDIKRKRNYLCLTCKYGCKHRRTLTMKSLLIYCPKYEMQDYSYLRESQNIRPTKPEKILDDNTSNSIKYVGDAKKWIKLNNGKLKNPDFIVKGQKKIIEVFGDYWHKNDDPQELINLYKQIGYDCIIFWEHEIHNDIDLIKEKVEIFISQ